MVPHWAGYQTQCLTPVLISNARSHVPPDCPGGATGLGGLPNGRVSIAHAESTHVGKYGVVLGGKGGPTCRMPPLPAGCVLGGGGGGGGGGGATGARQASTHA